MTNTGKTAPAKTTPAPAKTTPTKTTTPAPAQTPAPANVPPVIETPPETPDDHVSDVPAGGAAVGRDGVGGHPGAAPG